MGQDPTLEALRAATARIEARLARLEGRAGRARLSIGLGVAAALALAFAAGSARGEGPRPALRLPRRQAAGPAEPGLLEDRPREGSPARRPRIQATTLPAVLSRDAGPLPTFVDARSR